MVKGFDCATSLTETTAAAFRADGHAFVCRYLVPSGWKRLTREEAELISEAGLEIVSVYETTADRALGGYAAGIADGKAALAVAAAVGQPEGSTIYFAVDFDATAAQMDKVIDYIHGCSLATPGYSTGVYGSYAVVEAVRAAEACSRFWQTYAWSRGRKADGIHIYQYQNDITVNGISVDMDEGYGDNCGWSLRQAAEQEEMGDDVMNELILTTTGWAALAGSLEKAYKGGVLGDYHFVEKAFIGKLTRSELEVANNLIIVNSMLL
ncbi:DUF1906 domain-containing protein [Paenibacillus ginsengarvi]|uniref:DUF1906 domain-containing protein n=1 Tax=Paenibacillus ginsengarvi TaxID=400777 RepID=A0A3B0BQC2_9BACL|nr:DUF1906 domain-containing protein [Paenibacillus ginsengarvi]RKN74990.1 DUF1906 domain-containing protein [Paenibacillus ginsengarvi]